MPQLSPSRCVGVVTQVPGHCGYALIPSCAFTLGPALVGCRAGKAFAMTLLVPLCQGCEGCGAAGLELMVLCL